ncbi:30S ribosome-binding factor RbfA [candidate division KSB1 bacterium]
MDFKRKRRVEETIKVNLGQIIQRELTGKMPGMATIMHVGLTDDLRYAKIKVSILGSDEVRKESFGILKREAKKIRRQLGRVLTIKHNPYLNFEEDTSLDYSFRIDALLSKIQQNGNKPDEPEK